MKKLQGWMIAGLAGSAWLMSGCGGGGGAAGSSVRISLRAANGVSLNDLELIVAPKGGPATDSDACDNFGVSFCGSDAVTNNTKTFRITTENDRKDYFIYVRNNTGGGDLSGRLTISIDNITDTGNANKYLDIPVTVPSNTAVRYARIGLNNLIN